MPSHNLYLKPKYLKQVQGIIANICPNAEVWAYGSRVDGDDISVHCGTDLDLAIMNADVDYHTLAELKEAFTESTLPILVDVFLYHQLPKSFQQEIQKKHITIQ